MAKRERIQWKNQAVHLVAIAIGAYLAFSVIQYRQRQTHDRVMKRYLAGLQADLQQDLEIIQRDLRTLRDRNRACTLLLQHARKKIVAGDSLPQYLQAITSQTTFQPHPYAYHALIANTDVAHLIDPELSRQLAALYNGAYENIRLLDALTLQHVQTHVINRRVSGSAFKKSYVRSAAFQGLVEVQADFNRQKIDAYTKAEAGVKSLQRLIDQMRP